jgi:hypothetical protein
MRLRPNFEIGFRNSDVIWSRHVYLSSRTSLCLVITWHDYYEIEKGVKNAPQQDQFKIISLCFELFCILARRLCFLISFCLSSLFQFICIYRILRRIVIVCFLFASHSHRALRCYTASKSLSFETLKPHQHFCSTNFLNTIFSYFPILGRLVQRHENSETWQHLLHETDREDLAEISCVLGGNKRSVLL